MGDESRYRYRRDDAATGSGPGSRPAQAASGDRAGGRDPLAELARLMDHDPFDDFDGLPPDQQTRSAAPQQSAAQQSDTRGAPAQRLAPPQPPRAALQPPSRAAVVEPDYDEDDDAESWNTAPARQPAVPARAAPSYAPEPQSRVPQGYGQSGYAQPAPSYAPAPRPVDTRTADVRLGYGSLARDAAAARAVPPRQQPVQDYDDYDDYDDGVDDPHQPDPRSADPRARAGGYGQAQAPQSQQAYGWADAQGYRQDARSQDPRAQDARYQDPRYQDDRRPASGQQAQQARYDDETDEAGYAYSAARRDEDYDYDDYDDRYDPEYADDGYMPPHGDDMYEPEPRRRRGRTALLLGVSLVGLVVAGVAGVFAYNMAVGRSGLMSSSGGPPVIKADSAPAKTTTPATTADAQKSIYDRVGGPVTAGNEKMVPREEQPVDVTSAARAPADSAPAPTQQPMQATQNLTEPKRVRTMTVRADGSVTPGVPSSAVSAYAPSQNPIPVGLPQPNPVTTVPASAPADATASTSPAPTAAGTYVVQVASQRSESDALGSWKALQAKYPNLLGSYKATVKKADLGDKGIYYRAQVGPFASRDQANELCQSLRAQGGDCVVTKL